MVLVHLVALTWWGELIASRGTNKGKLQLQTGSRLGRCWWWSFSLESNLVGGFNQAEKYVSQLGNLTQIRGEHAKKMWNHQVYQVLLTQHEGVLTVTIWCFHPRNAACIPPFFSVWRYLLSNMARIIHDTFEEQPSTLSPPFWVEFPAKEIDLESRRNRRDPKKNLSKTQEVAKMVVAEL